MTWKLRKARAFLKGVREFRSTLTTHYEDLAELEAYDWGREIAHRATFRVFDPMHY